MAGKGFDYTVKVGDTPAEIAKRFSFKKWKEIYDHAKNKAHRDLRPEMDYLFPGDVIFIPDRNPGAAKGVTGLIGRFVKVMIASFEVTKVKAKLPTTKSARGAFATAAPKTHHEFSSTSKKHILKDNPPTVVVRNCEDIQLEVETNPPGIARIEWRLLPNPGPKIPAPTLVAVGAKATLKTNGVGGWLVSASLGTSTVIWNIVIVDLVVKSSKVIRNSKNFVAKTQPGYLSVSSGIFDVTAPAKCGMHTTAKVKFSVGGIKSLATYCDKVHAGITNVLQLTSAKAEYDGGGKERERIPSVSGLPNPVVDPATVVVDLGYPILDRGGDKATRATGGKTIFLSQTRSTPETGLKRKIETCDSPAVGFDALLPEKGKAATKKMTKNVGVNDFKVYLTAYSDDANYSYVVFGHAPWIADYTGKVKFAPASTTPVWTKNGAGITGAGSKLTVISGGKEAKAASCEVRPPVYLTYILDAR